MNRTLITTPRIRGLELHLPPGTVITDHDGEVVTELSITPIPVERPPFPLPAGVAVPIYFTIQPGAAYVDAPSGAGARLLYPNYTDEPPGTRVNFWRYSPEHGWYVYGKGTVTADGTQVVPDEGVQIYEFLGAMINVTGYVPPPEGPKPDVVNATDGDPVHLGTGLCVVSKTDLFLPDVLPIVFTRVYRPGDTVSRAFGIGATHAYDLYLFSAEEFQEADLVLPDGGRIHYERTSPGTGFENAVFAHNTTPGIFYQSVMFWNGHGWDLRLRDGTVYVFGDSAPLQAIRDRYGNRIRIQRSATNPEGSPVGKITEITAPHGRYIRFLYDTADRVIRARDHRGRAVHYTYDAQGRLETVTDPEGGVTTYTYDAAHRVLTIRDARGIVFLSNQYDAQGRVMRQTEADGTFYEFAYTTDASGQIIQTDVTDRRGVVRRVTFNTEGFVTSDTRAVGLAEQQTTTYERQAGSNLVLAITDALNRRTALSYDALGNVTSLTRLAGTMEAVTTSFTYEPTFSQVTAVTDPSGRTTSFTYDGVGNLTRITNPLGNETTLTYNGDGQPVTLTDPLGNTTTFAYDDGDLEQITDPLGNTTTRDLDNVGRVIQVTHPLPGHTTQYQYDELNRLTQVTPFPGIETTFAYDANGNLLSVTDARGNTTSYVYDVMDRLFVRVDPLGRAEGYLYDPNGNLSVFTDRKGQSSLFTYDALNRRTQVSYADLSTTAYTYDAGNRLTAVQDSLAGTISRAYDNLDRLIDETTPQGQVLYAYDAVGRRLAMAVAGQEPVFYLYDDADRLTNVIQGTRVVGMAYDDADRRTILALPNGVAVFSGYDAASRLTSLTYVQGPVLLGTLTYGYDALGQRIQMGGTLAAMVMPQAVASATYDAANQQTSFGVNTLTYDANGNLTVQAGLLGVTTYTWNARNQLVSVVGTSGVALYGYDGLGRRVSRTVNGVPVQYLYDGVNVVQESLAGIPTANLLTGLGVDEIFSRTDIGGERYFLTDALGSTIALTDQAGNLQTQYTYGPFGETH